MSHKDTDAHKSEKHEAKGQTEETEVKDIVNEEFENDEAEAQAQAAETSLAEELEAARQQIEKEKKDYLFLMAEFDNFRKRVIREKADLVKNAAEKVLLGLLPVVDDFERGLAATAEETSGQTVREGMELIYNKIVKYLEDNGVKAMESTGASFDADVHEAIATVPAPDREAKGKVLDTVQKGYSLNDKVLRHAKVVVGE